MIRFIWCPLIYFYEKNLDFGSESHNDVKLGCKFADVRSFYWRKINRDGRTRLLVFDAAINTVFFVFSFAFDVTLGGPLVASFHFDGEMDVPGSARIKDRLNGAEIILASGPGEKTAKALEVFIAGS